MGLLPWTGKTDRPTPSQQELGPKLHTHGYHGTTVYDALRITRDGFDPQSTGLSFYPTDELAAEQAKDQVLEVGQTRLAIIQAIFPATKPLELPDGPPRIEIPQAQIGEISMVGSAVIYPVTAR